VADLPRDDGLVGRRVAFTGRLASLTRAEAARLVASRGGEFSPSVSRSTDLLVVGAAGVPLRRGGRPTRKLARAEALSRRGARVEVVSEEAFLGRAGVTDGTLLRLHPLPAVASLAGADVSALEGWVRSGLVTPAEVRNGVPLFGFAAVAAAKSLCRLLDGGAPAKTVRRSLAALGRFKGDAAVLITKLSAEFGVLALRTAGGRRLEPHGQIVFDFAEEGIPDGPATLSLLPTGEDLFVEALGCEAAGDLAGATALYRRLLLEEGPDPDVCFNLANVLYARGDAAAAAGRYRRAAELDPGRADAWLNLGNVLAETGDAEDAASAFRLAVEADPGYADARAELADTLDRLGDEATARPHWRAYLDLEPDGPWANYARSRIADSPVRSA